MKEQMRQFILVHDLYNHRMNRKTEIVVKGRVVDRYTFYGWLIHSGIRLGDHEGIPGRQEPREFRPFSRDLCYLITDLPGPDGTSEEEELVDVLSEDELLDQLLEEELDEADPEVELELVEATLASGYGDLPGIRHLHLWAEDDEGGGILAAGPRGSSRFRRGHRIENLFGFPTFILSGDAGHHSAINKGWEAGELRVSTLSLGVG
ncbi:hypothetical protein Cgig2_025733 [Carnegiea gigantea]|uniref:Uncharacterized protein n=1 Tax=Carnegiea gigantea TaxID=171969 RepID=A0A9Q1GLG3_9CARY|nr:hypothetical protein Cgig2_025733 [Carnegiea gigantea]